MFDGDASVHDGPCEAVSVTVEPGGTFADSTCYTCIGDEMARCIEKSGGVIDHERSVCSGHDGFNWTKRDEGWLH